VIGEKVFYEKSIIHFSVSQLIHCVLAKLLPVSFRGTMVEYQLALDPHSILESSIPFGNIMRAFSLTGMQALPFITLSALT